MYSHIRTWYDVMLYFHSDMGPWVHGHKGYGNMGDVGDLSSGRDREGSAVSLPLSLPLSLAA
jgi:hypothetical protein